MNATEINSVIDHLAAKLAVPVGELMNAIPAFGIQEVVSLVWFAVLMVFGISLFVIGKRTAKQAKHCKSWDQEEKRTTYAIISIIGGLGVMTISLIIFADALSSTVLWFYDPKAWTVKYLLNLIK